MFFGNYVFDNELIVVNGLITLLLVWATSKRHVSTDLSKA